MMIVDGWMRIDGPKDAAYTLILAHGSGAGMDTYFMEYLATEMGKRGIRVIRFEFPYMRDRRRTGTKKPPNPITTLEKEWCHQIGDCAESVVIAGKSMGGRVATRILSDSPALGCIVFGYPFHPPSKPEKLRVEHLKKITKPVLIVQGSRDPFGKKEEKMGAYLSSSSDIHWLQDGDHSFKTRKSSGRTWEQNLDEAVDRAAEFIIQTFDRQA